MAQSRCKEPPARSFHAAVALNRHMLVWGGDGGKKGRIATSTVEIYDLLSTTWQETRQLRSPSLPDNLSGMAVACYEQKAYTFGGFIDDSSDDESGMRINDVYEVDLTSFDCTKLEPSAGSAQSPKATNDGAVVYCRRKLVNYGGFTDDGSSDKLHVFDLDTKIWTAPVTTGEKPPALKGHSLTMIDQHRALLFGGYKRGCWYNDIFLLDIDTWQWNEMNVSGKKLPVRSHHTACLIDSTDDHVVLMIVGGQYGMIMLSDVWFLDVTAGSWSEVSLPTSISERCGHSAVVFGTGPDFRVGVLFGGNKFGFKIAETTLLFLSRKEGSWTVDKVYPPHLHPRIDELQGLQISDSPRHTDDEFPDVHFLGEPQEVPVPPVGSVIVSPPGLGATLTVPAGAVSSDPDTPANVTLKMCLPAPSFSYPEGYTPVSGVYHVSSSSNFVKSVELTFEHFAKVETEEQVNEVVLLRAKSSPTVRDGKREFVFNQVEDEGGNFAVGEGHCIVSTQSSGFASAGSLQNSAMRKRYAVLCSYPSEVGDTGHAAIAVTVDDEVYMKNFREAVQQEWGASGPISHRFKLNVSYNEADALVEYPQTLSGWNIVSDSPECTLSREDVNISNPAARSLYAYPPRVFFKMTPTENAEPCTLQLCLSGLSKNVGFQICLGQAKTTAGKVNGVVAMERPSLLTLGVLATTDGGEIRVIEETANYYDRIGPILLNDRYGERVDTIKRDERGKGERIILEIYKRWMREDVNYSWTTLTKCLREGGLNRLAHSIEQHFGLPSPPEPLNDFVSTERDVRPRKRPILPKKELQKINCSTWQFLSSKTTDGCNCCVLV